MSLKSKRYHERDSWASKIDRVETIVKEVAMLSLVGKVVYDVETDTVSLEDTLYISSLGLHDTTADL